MSEHTPNLYTPRSGIDILTLFREDIDQRDRIQLFKQAAEQLRGDIDVICTPENITSINEMFDVTVVLNPHSSDIDAAQSLAHIKNPFITFVEAAGAEDIHREPTFELSVQNAFDVKYGQTAPQRPPFPLMRDWDPSKDNSWHYWQYRGLFAKGSIVAPIDVRRYSHRLLKALIDADYSQEYLNQTFSIDKFKNTPYEELLDEAKNRGELNMYANGVRELISTKQTIESLLMLQDPTNGAFRDDTADKIIALRDKAQRSGDLLPAYVMYGTAHHGFYRELKTRGIPAKRVFADSSDVYYPKPFKFIGDTQHAFFNGRHYDTSEEAVELHAKSVLLESLLSIPVYAREQFGLVHVDRADRTHQDVRLKILKLSQDPELLANLPEIIEEFKNDPRKIISILQDSDLPLLYLDDPS